MRTDPPRTRILHLVRQAAWWRPLNNRQRRERAALAARATESRDGIPADVIGMVAVGQKIRAIKRYRELTGVELKEAKAIIEGL